MAEPGTVHVEPSARREDGTIRVTLRLHIPRDTHIQAYEPALPSLVPTEVDFRNLDPDRVSYPDPVEKDLRLPGPPLLVYENRVTIVAKGRADGGLRTVRGAVRYQPCVGGACLPPREVSWDARVEPRTLAPSDMGPARDGT